MLLYVRFRLSVFSPAQAPFSIHWSCLLMFRKTAFSLVCLLICSAASGARLSAQTWTQYGPLARFSHTGVFDPVTKQTIVFGGQNPSTNTDLNDLWLIK